MRSVSRRDFLASTSAAGLSLFGLPRWLHAAEAPPACDMTISRWRGEGSPPADLAARLTSQAITGLGGMGRFVHRGDTVWIKPNIGWNRTPDLAANTHPDVVAELVRLCLDAGAKKVKVGDNPCNDARETYANSGIAPAALEAGAEIVYLDERRFRDMTINGNRLKEHPVYPDIVECDLVINVPVVKHHGATKVTLCMKNYMGVVDKRRVFHQDLTTTISDISQFMKPRLCVLDATRMLTANGPTSARIEDVKPMHIVSAGVDIVALDAFGAELLGHKPADIPTIQRGAEYGLGRVDYRSLTLRELDLS